MSNNSSFLPDDYLDQRADRRTNLISLVLFAVVMLAVFMAFLFTNRRWSEVKTDQLAINDRYQRAAEQITELMELEEQKSAMLQKAELAAALVERVPRSFLLAELINRMPEQLSLLEFDLGSEKIKAAPPPREESKSSRSRLKPARARTREDAADEVTKVRPPRYNVDIALVGVAPTGLQVSRYLAELNAYPLLQDVNLEYSEEREIEGQVMQQFEIRMKLDPDADVRDIDPLIVPRTINNPMSDQLRLTAPTMKPGTVFVQDPARKEGE